MSGYVDFGVISYIILKLFIAEKSVIRSFNFISRIIIRKYSDNHFITKLC